MAHLRGYVFFVLIMSFVMIRSVRLLWSGLRSLRPQLTQQNESRTESRWRQVLKIASACVFLVVGCVLLRQVHPIVRIETYPFYDPRLHHWQSMDKDGTSEDAAIVKSLDRVTRSFFERHRMLSRPVGICMGAVCGGRRFVFSAGHLGIDSVEVPDADTLFEIGSITKVFTGQALAHCVGQNLVSLETPLSSLLPDWEIPLESQITLKVLATHHSGLPQAGKPLSTILTYPLLRKSLGSSYSHFTAEISRAYLAGFRSSRESFLYSNFGVGLLGFALSKKGNRTYEEMVKEFICEPIGMKDTHVQIPEEGKRVAQGYVGPVRLGPLSLLFREDTLPCTDVYEGAMGLRSTVNDLLRYIEAHITAPNGPAGDDLARAQSPLAETDDKNCKIGMCLMIESTKDGLMYWHGGSIPGFYSYLAFSKEHAVGVVMLANGCVDDSIAKEVFSALVGNSSRRTSGADSRLLRRQ